MSGIRVSKKHGVNPSIDTCPKCGGASGLILFGRLPQDKEAPRMVSYSLELCNDCKTEMEKNELIFCMEAEQTDNGIRPKGEYLTMSDKNFKGFGNDDKCIFNIAPKSRQVFLETEVFQQVKKIMLEAQEKGC